MSKFKFLLPLVAIVLIAASVFAMKAKKVNNIHKTTNYFEYSGPDETLSNLKNTANWTQVSSPSVPGCSGSGIVCTVNDTRNLADFDTYIQSSSFNGVNDLNVESRKD